MSIPYIALYPGDFLADTGHLGNTELGIYWRLLLVYYRDARPLPVDMDRLRRLAMTFSPEECRALESVLPEFFILTAQEDGTRCWRHKRADIELNRATSAHTKKSEAAKATNAKRWGRGSLSESLGESLSDIAKRPNSDGEPEPEPDSPKRELPSVEVPRKRAAAKPKASKRCPQDFTPSEELVAWVLSDCPGVNWTRETASFKDWEFKTARSDWPATWRSWMRKAFDSMQQRRAAGPESFRAQDERIAAESVRRLTGGLAHNRAAVGEAPPREVLPFERGYVKPTTDTIEGDADVRRIR